MYFSLTLHYSVIFCTCRATQVYRCVLKAHQQPMLSTSGTNNDFAINISLVFLQVPSSRSTTNVSLR